MKRKRLCVDVVEENTPVFVTKNGVAVTAKTRKFRSYEECLDELKQYKIVYFYDIPTQYQSLYKSVFTNSITFRYFLEK